MDPRPGDGSTQARPPLDTQELSYYGSVGLACTVVVAWALWRAPGSTGAVRLLLAGVMLAVSGVGAYHLAMAVGELQRPLHHDMPTGELGLGLVVGIAVAATYWVRASLRAREDNAA